MQKREVIWESGIGGLGKQIVHGKLMLFFVALREGSRNMTVLCWASVSFALLAFEVSPFAAGAPLVPYPSSQLPTTSLYVIAESGRSPSELLLIESISGNLARTTPSVYRVAEPSWNEMNTTDPASVWLQVPFTAE